MLETLQSALHECSTQSAMGLLSLVHVNMPWKYLRQCLDTILDLRMNLEIGLDGISLDKETYKEFEAIARKLQERKCRITLHGPFRDLNPGSVDPIIRRVSRFRLSQFMDVSEIFRPIAVVCHTGFDPRHHPGPLDPWVNESLQTWEFLIKMAEKLQVPFLLENVWEKDPELHLALFEKLPSSHFGFCFDVGHQHCFSESTMAQWLPPLMDYLGEVHLHDNDGLGDRHLPVGKGAIDFKCLFDTIQKHGARPVLTVEPHTGEHLPETLQGLKNILGNDLEFFMI